jgi:hypothetical protein
VKEFWWLASFVISMLGFTLVAVLCVLQGQDLFYVAIKSIGTFVGLWVIQSFLRTILVFAATSGREGQETGRNE